MSSTHKTVIAVVVLAVVAGGLYYWLHMRGGTEENGVFTTASTTLPSGSDTSDQGLEQDTAAIDAQLKGLDSDNASVNESLNDSSQVQ